MARGTRIDTDQPGNPAGAESTIHLIGPRLRAARYRAALSMDQLADRSGLTKGFISQLERDRTSPSVGSLVRICEVLGISVGSLFEAPRTLLVRRSEARPHVNAGGVRVTDYILTPRHNRVFQVIESQIGPAGGSGAGYHALQGDAELVYVIEGALEIVVGENTHVLAAGDALTFAPGDPHSWRNPSPLEAARVVWVLAPSSL